ncbi:hypothetical protein D1BOALGB6SA_309 [Olavius sp. associated proteobacterium Delta 1]|nr:hypothetical protein D1BOALGB6SA_309 [Olavius sp. associated proteobacterium Delta 1]
MSVSNFEKSGKIKSVSVISAGLSEAGERYLKSLPYPLRIERTSSTAGEIETLKMQAESLKSALDSISKRMDMLEKTND